ncbi:hypothetical protein [Arthrobacter sp. NyZ413]|uniref:hypothetical protein n=1 Tax=Arthrobacter sp. NyZ413 TaxID=3144669 RepID=UPI003BF89448
MCSEFSRPVHAYNPLLLQATLARRDHEYVLELHYRGELPGTGNFIIGVEVPQGAGGGMRHCCLEFQTGKPLRIFTYDFRGNWQSDHDLDAVKVRSNVVSGTFPAWSFDLRTPVRAMTAFAIHNGVVTASGLAVTGPLPGRAVQAIST